MNIEYEATFANIDKDAIRARLTKLSATRKREEFLQKRYCFDVPEECTLDHAWVRVRDEGDRVTMTLKDIPPKGGAIEDQKELEVVVGDFKTTVEILRNMGLTDKSYQETKREIWKLDEIEIMIDEWPWLEPFIEIEGGDEKIVKAAARELDLAWSEAIFGAVSILYNQKYGVAHDVINNQTKRFVFDEPNPFL